jgi:Cdc6-like AAA superfamily ATPase
MGNTTVSCLKLTSGYLQENERNSTSLYLRDNQIELWNEVYAYLSEPGSNAIVTGNSGIGKSRSMTYLLKLLLKNKKNVIYEARKDKKVFAFTVQVDGTYDVEVCTDVYIERLFIRGTRYPLRYLKFLFD